MDFLRYTAVFILFMLLFSFCTQFININHLRFSDLYKITYRDHISISCLIDHFFKTHLPVIWHLQTSMAFPLFSSYCIEKKTALFIRAVSFLLLL